MTRNFPSNCGFGVYSKGAMSSETTCRLTMSTPSRSAIAEIIITWSCAASGNLSGDLQHSARREAQRDGADGGEERRRAGGE